MRFAMANDINNDKANKILEDYLSGKPLRVAVIIRVSTTKEEQKTSLANQEKLFKQMIEEKGWILYDFYADVKSGTKYNRKGLDQLIQDAKDEKFDLILSKELSRLARNVPLSYKLKDIISKNNIHIKTLDGAIDTLNKNQDNFGLYAWLYQKESQNTSDRIKQALRTNAKDGEFIGSLAPYGYYVKNKTLYIRNDNTPEIVRRIFREYIEGRGFDAIARNLYNEGIPTPSQISEKINASDKWHGSTIKKILMNPHYIGMLVQCRDTKPSVIDERKKVQEKDYAIKENTHEAIVSPEIYWAAQDLIISRSRTRPQQEKHFFTNTIFCEDCGRGMHYKKNRKGYVCGNYNKHGEKACTPHYIKEDQIINVILNDLSKVSLQMKLEDKFDIIKRKINKKIANETKEIARAERELTTLKKDIIKLTKDFSKRKIRPEAYKLTIKDIEEDINKIEKKKIELELKISNTKQKINIDKIQAEINDYIKFDQLTSELIHLLINRIEVKEYGDIKIYYRVSDKSFMN
ncbi:recombinase family protein [Heyndrickxia vini]|uniref:Recombinase family protein n=2 Tax=Bacillaceae TaxID=186817 RepID=A0ABX7E008_9BACI|nr:recombinase family protein [Heyndrickxia vini]